MMGGHEQGEHMSGGHELQGGESGDEAHAH